VPQSPELQLPALTKAEYLARKLGELARGNETPMSHALRGAVVYFDCSDRHMRELGQWLQARLDADVAGDGVRMRVFMILSSHSPQARQKTMASVHACAAREDERPVLLVRYRICGVGVNYIFANHVFFYTMPHRADYLHQAVGRLCRLGQASREICAWPIVFRRQGVTLFNSFEFSVWQRWKAAVTINEQNRNMPQLPAIMHSSWQALVDRVLPLR
jgi:hypothetical protein